MDHDQLPPIEGNGDDTGLGLFIIFLVAANIVGGGY